MTVVGSSVRMVRALGVKRATWETAGFLLSQHVLTIRNIRRIRKWEVPVTPLVKRNPVSVDPFAIQIWWVWENEKRISLALDRNTLQFAPPTHFLLFLCMSCTGSQYNSNSKKFRTKTHRNKCVIVRNFLPLLLLVQSAKVYNSCLLQVWVGSGMGSFISLDLGVRFGWRRGVTAVRGVSGYSTHPVRWGVTI